LGFLLGYDGVHAKKRFRPPVELSLSVRRSLWQIFRQHHYLSGSLASTARCYTATYQDRPIAFIAVVHTHMKTRYYRVTRLVVLPDYQGIGVGKRLLNFIAELCTSQTKVPFYILTSNPHIIQGNIENWKITRYGHASRGRENARINKEIRSSISRKRITVSLKYAPAIADRFAEVPTME
jgi:GNAT superfamily N-acetyltransferase